MIKIRQNTLLGTLRLESILILLRKVQALDGHVCEVGVYKGGTARLICLSTPVKVFLIDTFMGLPQVSPQDNYCKKGHFNDTSVEHVKSVLEPCLNYEIIQSEWPNPEIKTLDDLKFKFVHLDVDIYSSYKNNLDYFYPRMVPGGVIVMDDYNEPMCLGAKMAIDEFLTASGARLSLGPECQAFIVKRDPHP